jgi:hypothetical protein
MRIELEATANYRLAEVPLALGTTTPDHRNIASKVWGS